MNDGEALLLLKYLREDLRRFEGEETNDLDPDESAVAADEIREDPPEVGIQPVAERKGSGRLVGSGRMSAAKLYVAV
jgi:hypothetical protein